MTQPEASRLKVFLSHASENKQFVRLLYERLRADGAEPWFDQEELLPGHHFRTEIERAVRHSDVVILCLSSSSINKVGYVQREIAFALDSVMEHPHGSIFIIPLLLEPCEVPGVLEHLSHCLAYEEGWYDRLLSALRVRARSLGRILERRGPPPVSGTGEPAPPGSLAPEVVDIFFRQAFMEAFWERGTPPVPRRPGCFTVSLVGETGVGKTSLAFVVTRASLKLLDRGRASASPYRYLLPLDGRIFLADHPSWSDGAAPWREVLEYLKSEADLVLFLIKAERTPSPEVREAFAQVEAAGTPLLLLANRVDLVRGRPAASLLDDLRGAFGRTALPASAGKGVGIAALRKLLELAPRMYT